MSRDYLFRNKFQPPKKFGVKMGVKKSLEFFFWQKEEGIVSRRPLFFFVFGRFFVFLVDSSRLEKKVELVSRARILKPNVGAERETDRKKERRRRKASIHPFYAGDPRVRLPPSRLKRIWWAKERHFLIESKKYLLGLDDGLLFSVTFQGLTRTFRGRFWSLIIIIISSFRRSYREKARARFYYYSLFRERK